MWSVVDDRTWTYLIMDDIEFYKNLLGNLKIRQPSRFYLARRSVEDEWKIVTVLEITNWSMEGDIPQISHGVYDWCWKTTSEDNQKTSKRKPRAQEENQHNDSSLANWRTEKTMRKILAPRKSWGKPNVRIWTSTSIEERCAMVLVHIACVVDAVGFVLTLSYVDLGLKEWVLFSVLDVDRL